MKDMSDTQFNTLLRIITQQGDRIEQVYTEMQAGFARINQRFAEIDKRFAKIDKRFTEIDKRFVEIDTRFTELQAKMDQGFADQAEISNTILTYVEERLAGMKPSKRGSGRRSLGIV